MLISLSILSNMPISKKKLFQSNRKKPNKADLLHRRMMTNACFSLGGVSHKGMGLVRL